MTVLVVLGLIVAGATVPINVVVEAPGPTWNVLSGSADGEEDLLTVSGTETYPADGALRMTTVSVSGCPGHPVTFFMLVDAWLDDDKTIVDRNQVCPESMTAEEIQKVGQEQMTGSQDAAVVAALMESGVATRMILAVADTVDAQAGAGFEKGDILESVTAADGGTTAIVSFTELRRLMSTIAPGTRLTVRVTRAGEPVDITLTTLEPPDQDGDGAPDTAGSILGLHLSIRTDADIEASFSLSDVGGPSAGTMFALGIIDEITPGDLTGGKDIAGTGTISVDGQIGPIGGIRQKLAGAADAGSTHFLAPTGNCAEVVGNVPDGMEVLAVSTLHEALVAVKAIAAGDTSALMTCETALASK